MTTEYFQKSANIPQELSLSHPGIIDSSVFDEHFQLHCYKPSPDLEPFVAYIWVQRQKKPLRSAQKPPIEILSGPNIYLFFTTETAFIHSITRHKFTYDPFASKVVAGVKFRPGGFYPFLGKSVSELNTHPTSITSVFPAADETFRKALLDQPDSNIMAKLEILLRAKQPKKDKSLDLVTEILNSLDNTASSKTVRSVAQAFHISERSLQLLFQTYVGIGLKWIITRKRLLKTVSQIKILPGSSQAEVAAELGYNSQSHFTREFKDAVGQPPSQHLKSSAATNSRHTP